MLFVNTSEPAARQGAAQRVEHIGDDFSTDKATPAGNPGFSFNAEPGLRTIISQYGGIEAILDKLRSPGVPFIQGFLIDKPGREPVEEIGVPPLGES